MGYNRVAVRPGLYRTLGAYLHMLYANSLLLLLALNNPYCVSAISGESDDERVFCKRVLLLTKSAGTCGEGAPFVCLFQDKGNVRSTTQWASLGF